LLSTFGRYTEAEMERILNDPDASELALLSKLSALAWTMRGDHSQYYLLTLKARAGLLGEERPVPGDTKELLLRLLKRPELRGEGIELMFEGQLTALTIIGEYGEPGVAVEILNRHVEDMERHLIAPRHVREYHVNRVQLLLAAASTLEGEEAKKGAYVAEAKTLMMKATRYLRGMEQDDWDGYVSDLI
jgi:hypothetical protein